MGLLKKIGKAVKKVAKVASKAAPVVGLIPGVGTLGAAALGAGGALIGGEGVGTALGRGALGAAGGLAGNALRGARGTSGALKGADSIIKNKGKDLAVESVLKKGSQAGKQYNPMSVTNTVASWMGNLGTDGTAMGAKAPTGGAGRGAVAAAPAGNRGVAGTAFDLLGGAARSLGRAAAANPLQAAQVGMAGLGMLQGGGAQGEADQLRRQALNLGVNEPQSVDLSSMFADRGNPYGMTWQPPRRRAAASAAGSLGY